MKVIPVGRKILVKPQEASSYFKGTTILIPESQRKQEAKGVVAGVGSGVAQIKPKDVVQYSDSAAVIKMQHDGEEHEKGVGELEEKEKQM